MSTKLISVAAGVILSVARVASGNGEKPAKFTVRVENITKPDAFTASNGVKWGIPQSADQLLLLRQH